MDVNERSIAELIKAARDELHDGSTESYLAFWRNINGDRDERLLCSDQLIALAESSWKSDDYDGAVELWSAFKTGLGCRDAADADKKAFRYINFLAEAGNAEAQEVLIMDYLNGANGLPLDKEKALYWCNRAIENGSKLAVKMRKALM